MAGMNRIDFFAQQMLATREYTLRVLEHTDRGRWYESPAGPVTTHIAWHVGHLAFAEYAQFMLMICGETPADIAAFPKDRYFSLFAKGTSARAQRELYPSPEELLADLASLHVHCIAKLRSFPEEQFETATLRPHQIARTRFDMAMWWIKHEMLHVGHIAMLRRLMGEAPWR